MKKSLLVLSILTVGFFASCISIQDSRMGPNDSELEVLDTVRTQFVSYQPFHIPITSAIKKTAYKRLLDQAKMEYAIDYGVDVLDIKNVRVKGDPEDNIGLMFITLLTFPLGNFQTMYATGTVVVNPNKSQSRINMDALENAVKKSTESFVGRLPRGSVIAVLSIATTNNARLIIDELEFRLVEMGSSFRIVERRLLEQIRNEQGFQLSGNVSDESAVSIGNMLGANIVITGSVTNSGDKQRLTLKALDVKTAQIIAMTREEF
jgi:hypothetical protein